MIKIDCFSENRCEVIFKVVPVRPSNIVEKELGKDVAKNSPDYYVADNGNIYRHMRSVALNHSIEVLKEMQEEAQREFSQKIAHLKKKLDEFRRLQKLTKEE